ncbi:hypothetical protein QYE76_018948, partial [Lolium multiflorum]
TRGHIIPKTPEAGYFVTHAFMIASKPPAGDPREALYNMAMAGIGDEDIPTTLLPPSLPNEDKAAVKLKYKDETSIARGGEEQLDVKMDVKLDMKIFHGRAREEREACAREEDEVQAPRSGRPPPRAAALGLPTASAGSTPVPTGDPPCQPAGIEPHVPHLPPGHSPVEPAAVPGSGRPPQTAVSESSRPSILGRGFEEEVGLGKPKFSIPKFEGGADVEEYLTWELKIEKLWRLHNYTEDRKIKLSSSEFDGYALRWWDRFVSAREEDGEPPIITWRAMKAAMNDRFVPTNYLRNIFDKLTLLRQGVKTVDEYYMEMEMLMQRGRVRESLEMTMNRFLNGFKYDIKGIIHHYSYTTMNELLHHAKEAESQLADEAKVKGRTTGARRFMPRAPPSTAPAPSTRSAPYSTPPSKPVSNVSNTKKSESAASTSGSSMSTARNRDMNCHTCGGKGHFRRDCPNRKVMIINEDNEYETGDDVDPNAPEDDDYDSDGVDAYPYEARTIVVS